MPRNGTPGFTGSRLREAREARGLTAASLADVTGVSRQVVSQYEHGVTAPSIETLISIAGTLNVPIDFFLLPSRDEVDRVVFFRSQAAATKGQRSKAERRLEWLEDLVVYLEHLVSFPKAELPVLGEPSTGDRLRWTAHAIEEAATEVRRVWDLGPGPIGHVVGDLERHGVIVTRGVVETDTIDAFSVRLEPSRRPAIFLGSDKDSAVRSRFDAVHELAHHVLHAAVSPKRLMNASERKAIESEAHAFASAFLLPAWEFARDLRAPTLDAMLIAKPRWGVSLGTMIQRCVDLEILRQDEAERLWISRAKRGWSKREPLDDDLPMEGPSLLGGAVDVIVQGGIKSREQLLTDLRMSAIDVEALAGLPDGYLASSGAPIRLLPRVGPRSTPPPIGWGADVIDIAGRRLVGEER